MDAWSVLEKSLNFIFKKEWEPSTIKLLLIIQELIQNAEDAKAERIVFMLDHTSYSSREGMLYDSGLALYQVCDDA